MNSFRKIQTRPRFTLYLEDESPPFDQITVERIGRGRFTVAYKDTVSNAVYLDVLEGECSKEILVHCQGEAHLPWLVPVGDTKRGRLYKSTYYETLKAEHREAWSQFKTLARCREDACLQARRKSWASVEHEAYSVNMSTIEMATGNVPDSLIKALECLTTWAASYSGGLIFEFPKKNLAVDEAGKLILLDPLFSLQAIRRQPH